MSPRTTRLAAVMTVLALAACASPGPAPAPTTPPAAPATPPAAPAPDTRARPTIADLPAIHLIARQAVALPGTPRALVATLLDLRIGETDHGRRAIAEVRLAARDGETLDVTWNSGEERQVLGSRLYLEVWRDAFVYVLP
jgi:hypothetical protein